MKGFWIAVLACALAPAQIPGGAFSQPALHAYGEKDGLPHPTVQTILQDPQGRIWVGTQDGAAVFNGKQWRTLNLPKEARSNYVRALVFDSTGTLWVGTQDDGLWQYRNDLWKRIELPTTPANPRINGLSRTLAADGSETIWVATGGAGLLRWQHQAWTQFDDRKGMPSSWVWSLRPGRNGVNWAATDGGLVRLEGDSLRVIQEQDGLPGKRCNESLETHPPGQESRVWACCWSKGLGVYEKGVWRAVPFPSNYPISLGESRTATGESMLWVGTNDMGVVWRIGEGPWQVLGLDQGLPAVGVYALLATGTRPELWMGLREGGLVALNRGGFVTFPRRGELANPAATAALETSSADGVRTHWIATEGGLTAWRNGRRLAVPPILPGNPNVQVNALIETGVFGGRKVVAGTMDGLAILEGDHWRLITRRDGLIENDVRTMLATRDDAGIESLWVTSTGGLTRFRVGRMTQWKTGEHALHPVTYALLETQEADGPSLWMGTRGGGVGRFKNGQFSAMGLTSGLPNLSVYALHKSKTADGKSLLLAGTFGGGLAWLEKDVPGGTWQVLSAQEQPDLPSNVILQITEDAKGRLYLATPRGLVRTLPPWRGGNWQMETFTEADGLPSRVCSRANLSISREGILGVGTRGGMAWLDVNQEPAVPPLPVPFLEVFSSAGKITHARERMGIPFRDQPLLAEYALPHYLNSEGTLFRTQILGLEDHPTAWSLEGKRDLGFLPKGRFTLRIQAKDTRGRSSDQLDVEFRVHPPPWSSPVAYTLYLALLAAALTLLVRLRLRVLRTRAEELEARVEQATKEIRSQKADLERLNARLEHLNEEKNQMLGIAAHDLRNPLNTLMLYTELLDGEQDPAEIAATTGIIKKGIQQMAELVKRLLDISHIDSGRMEVHLEAMDPLELAEGVVYTHSAKAQAKGLSLRLDVPTTPPPILADPVALREVLDNLVTNALKFTQPGPHNPEVVLRVGPGWIEVQDQGPGFSEEDKAQAFGRFIRLSARPTGGESSTGLGLSIVKGLVEAMGGTVALDSEPGRGTTFRIELQVALEG